MSVKSAAYPKENVPTLRYAAAALAFASELIHLWVVPGQLVAAILPGAFFLLVAACQGLLGASLLFGTGKWTLRFGILLNVFVILVWVLTRLVSVPELFEPLRLPVEGLCGRRDGRRGRALGLVVQAAAEPLPKRERAARLIRRTGAQGPVTSREVAEIFVTQVRRFHTTIQAAEHLLRQSRRLSLLAPRLAESHRSRGTVRIMKSKTLAHCCAVRTEGTGYHRHKRYQV